MQRVTMTVDEALLRGLDKLSSRKGYSSRSEALRDILRAALAEETEEVAEPCVAALTYVYNHGVRDLARRLVTVQHDHGALSVASLHVHVDHETCLEVVVLQGQRPKVTELADTVLSQRGVRHGHLHVIPASRRAV
jgi:CopG family transcriptional regulator, nickel-responsive regulator